MPYLMWIALFLQLLWFQVPFLFGVPAFEKAAGLFIHWIFRRTGRHLFLTDDVEGKPPLLKRLVEDDGDYNFMYVIPLFLPYNVKPLTLLLVCLAYEHWYMRVSVICAR